MQKFRQLWLIVISLLVLTIAVSVTAQQSLPVPVQTVDQINVRTGPGAEYERLGTVPIDSLLFMEARNIFGNWVIISTPDGELRGWVASRFLVWDDEIFLGNIPLSEEVIGGAAPQPEVPDVVADAPLPPPPPENPPPEVSLPPIAPDSIIGTVLVGTLYVRTGPGTEYDRIGEYTIEENIIVLGRNFIGNWVLTRSITGQTVGWVASRYVEWDDEILLASIPVSGQIIGLNTIPETGVSDNTTLPVPELELQPYIIPPDALIGTSLASNLNVRTGPGTEFARIDSLGLSEEVVVEYRNTIGNWLLIQPIDGGTRGWVASRYITWDDEEAFLELIPESTEIIGLTIPETVDAIPVEVPEGEVPLPEITPEPLPADPLLTPQLPPIPNPVPATVVVAGLNVRIADNIDSAIIDSLNNEEEIIIEARNFIGNWMLIRRPDGSTRGWVASRYLVWDDETLISDIPVYDPLINELPVPEITPEPQG